MTHEASQVLVMGDKAVENWLRDRFGIDTDKVYIRNRILMEFTRNDTVTLHVAFLVGADDLAAFPLAEPK